MQVLLGVWMGVLSGVAFASPAQDKAANALILQDIDGPTVVRILQEAGHVVALTTDPGGDPLVRAAGDGADYVVLFYDCDEGRCTSMQYRAWFEAPGMTAEMMNLWNQSSRLGRAYLDSDGDPTLEYNVRLAGGVTPEHLRHQRDWFLRGLAAFRDVLRGDVR